MAFRPDGIPDAVWPRYGRVNLRISFLFLYTLVALGGKKSPDV